MQLFRVKQSIVFTGIMMLILTSTFLVYVIFNDRDEIPVFEYASLVNSSFAAPFTHPHMDDMKNKSSFRPQMMQHCCNR